MNTQSEEFEVLVQSIRVHRPEVESVSEVVTFRPGYRFFPARVTLGLQGGERKTEVLKVANDSKSLEFERDVLVALAEIGLAVPQVTSPVIEFREDGSPRWGMLLQERDGRALDWLSLNDLTAANRTCLLTIEAVERLQDLTETVLQHPIGARLPRRTLVGELDQIKQAAGDWLRSSLFREALATLEELLPQIRVPLTFSNGDYNPLNFLAKDGQLVGWVDFEHACFEDPHIGFAKFLLWADDNHGWATGAKAGLVERYLFSQNVTPRDFSARVVLRGLSYLHRQPPESQPRFIGEVVKKHLEKLQ